MNAIDTINDYNETEWDLAPHKKLYRDMLSDDAFSCEAILTVLDVVDKNGNDITAEFIRNGDDVKNNNYYAGFLIRTRDVSCVKWPK